MGCGASQPPVDVLHTKKFLDVQKLLLLGTGESGKTTIIKQMKILHINGYTDTERIEKIPFIKQNIHESIYEIVTNMHKIDPPVAPERDQTKASIEFIISFGRQGPVEYTPEYFDHVKTAWKDEGVRRAFDRSNEYQLIDSAEHFLNKIDEVNTIEYIPTNQDILFCRIKTVAISKIDFKMPVPKKYGGGSAEFWMYDVGGQRGERKKWFKVFAGIQSVLFLIASSDFDLKLREDPTYNRLRESFELFQEVYTNVYLKEAAQIVFLNKQDILRRKIEQGRKLDDYFPEFKNYIPTGKEQCDTEYDRAKLFMKQKILDIANTSVYVEHMGLKPGQNITEQLAPRDVYVHFTVATDTNNIKKVFDSIHESILNRNVQDIGLL
ncbi:unnamed protein product [Phyllotreta striolata]|uniref:Guanine nucleotide-binding protein G(s) subunit alpha n=1 Tax=Phyllotreta striolata TaxID=444603 RepID=A0A9N9TVL7_PHYSR|nr:unnamed protein product [Phyllotreta striolata]